MSTWMKLANRARICSLAGIFQFMGPEILEKETDHTTLVDAWRPGASRIQVQMDRALLLRAALCVPPFSRRTSRQLSPT